MKPRVVASGRPRSAWLLPSLVALLSCASPPATPPPDETVTIQTPPTTTIAASETAERRVAVNEPRADTPPSDPTTRSLCLGDCQRESAACDKRAGSDSGQLRICGSRLIGCRDRCLGGR